jgi:hypothetical protein
MGWVVREIRKMNTNKSIEGGVEELDRHLSTIILTKTTWSSRLINLQKQYNQRVTELFKPQIQGRRTERRSQSPGGRKASQ